MMNSLWIAKTGMTAQQTNLDVVAHNLANASTTGFKRNFAVFADLMYQNQRQVGAQTGDNAQLPTGMHMGMGVNVGAISRSFEQGSLQETKNQLDIAINGNGFFQVENPTDGLTYYTRAGNFTRNAAGEIVTHEGYRLLPVTNVDPGDTITITAAGKITVTKAGPPPSSTSSDLQLANFVNPAGLEPVGNNLFRDTIASGAPETGGPLTNSFGEIKQGFLENSNINIVETLVNMIQTQRAYEMNSKAIQTSDQMLAKLGQL